jgi:rhodanese-related sulfurtransferase
MKSNPVSLFAAAAVLAIVPLTTFSADEKPKEPGKSESAQKNVTVDEAEKLLKERKDVVVVDVRTADEFKAGHIAGAKNVSLLDSDFEEKIKAYEGKPVLVHCGSGSRSARALIKMSNLKFPEAYHMNAGLKGWQAAGKPVVKE